VKVGVLVVGFGEPDQAVPDKVEPFLERIFLQNRSLEGQEGQAAVARARELARRRAPGLVAEYAAIGGSPLNAQVEAQARRLADALGERGTSAPVRAAFQFTAPFVDEQVARARTDGADALVVLPLYPLCGPSTTVAALNDVERALEGLGWRPPCALVSGWHREPAYVALRAARIGRFARERALDLGGPDTLLYFSAHGTPLRYLDEGSRYDRYVAEHCADLARALGGVPYAVGFQNHANRGIPWSSPDNEACIAGLQARRLVVDPVSFLFEQSETLVELDHELRAFVEGQGMELHRVPTPHDEPGLTPLLADLVGEALRSLATGASRLDPCRCHPGPTSWCTNGARELPPSPFALAPGSAPA
jgi:ferrochelatase